MNVSYTDGHENDGTHEVCDVPAKDVLESLVKAYGAARVFELCYWASEPRFFDTIRALFTMPEPSREALQSFLAIHGGLEQVSAVIEADGRLTFFRRALTVGQDSRAQQVLN